MTYNKPGRMTGMTPAGTTQFPAREISTVNQRISTKTVALTVPSAKGVTASASPPTTSVAGSGSGSGDRFVWQAVESVLQEVTIFGSGLADTWGQGFLWGHRERMPVSGSGSHWRPKALGHVKFQLGQGRGDGTYLPTAHRYADRITVISDYTRDGSMKVIHAASGGAATLSFDAGGHQFLEFEPLCAAYTGDTGDVVGIGIDTNPL